MKYLLIAISTIFLLVLAAYKYINYQFIEAQESSFKELSTLNFTESQRIFADSLKLSDGLFWSIIDDSKKRHSDNFDEQMIFLEQELSRMSNADIVGFERTLREKVIELWAYDTKALYQIIHGEYLSTDGFIYFRFWVISNGSLFYQNTLTNVDDLAEMIEATYDGENLLYVADRAFELKNGTESGLDFPRDQSYTVSYDFGNYKMSGDYVSLKEYEVKYPKLTAKF